MRAANPGACRITTVLIEGAIVMAHTTCDLTGIGLAKDTARQLLESYQMQE